ncbi:radical SAM family heme chaperone HemW [Buchnera aphidicola (Hyadaphis tataricae)]|uniref:Heme chaperone HemW n=1 Tax=Buchnera aphidicola (Hyadaphis tataricae) TaxID=1241859 RepID=A0A4D6XZB3_9GAMM|nr:radical SAM family heme chaperone HemW [Buchnera aphidicola]QCI21823.1 radical SAM family heme chaperone HemW [Buchnera aphidicola (Hyadaphis tataricae)]
MFQLDTISLYIHIPWCLKKCGYCDFYSYVSKEKIPEEQYIEHLLKDFEKDLHLIHHKNIKTIFIGGGTPSLLKSSSIKKLINGIKKRAVISKNTEISIEANPTTIESKRFLNYQMAGINRFSLGIQTFNEAGLKKIERTYNKKEAIQSIKILKQVNNNINIDLMYGLPNQSLEEALLDLQCAIQWNPNHISWYQFTLEPNTIFYSKKIITPHEDLIFKMFTQGDKLLKKSGYKKYEISSYAKFNKQCKHNLNYWHYGDYIGLGCGAHGKITQKNGKIIRTLKNKNINCFLNGNYLHSINMVSKKDKIFEYFMNVFRLYEPVFKQHFTKKTNIEITKIEKDIQIAIKKGFLIDYLDYWKTTKQGKLFLNSLLKIFL